MTYRGNFEFDPAEYHVHIQTIDDDYHEIYFTADRSLLDLLQMGSYSDAAFTTICVPIIDLVCLKASLDDLPTIAATRQIYNGYEDYDVNEVCLTPKTEQELLDIAIEYLWEKFGDIPMDPETETMEESFLHFPAGTPREEIWHWFDQYHGKGIHYLLYERGAS